MDDIDALRRILDEHAQHLIGDAEFRVRIDSRIDALEDDLATRKQAAIRWRTAFVSALFGLFIAAATVAIGRL